MKIGLDSFLAGGNIRPVHQPHAAERVMKTTTEVPTGAYYVLIITFVVGLGALAGEGLTWLAFGAPSKRVEEQREQIREMRIRIDVLQHQQEKWRFRTDELHRRTQGVPFSTIWDEPAPETIRRTAPNPIPPAGADDMIPPTNLPEK
jgi:hypothetical protein